MLETREFSTVKGSSARAFGLVFAGIFALIALLPLVSGHALRWWALGLALGFLVVALMRPVLLEPLNRLWFRFGILLGRIMTPVVMFVIYTLTIIPIGLILRLSGKDPMARRFDPSAKSYWIKHAGAGSMKRQF
jgi:hypothetical protein